MRFLISLFVTVLCGSWVFADQQEVVIAADRSYAPFEYLDENGEPQGAMIEFWQEIAERQGFKVRFELDDWSKAIPKVLAGQADVADALFYSEERAEVLDFSIPFFQMEAHVFFHQDLVSVKSLDHLAAFKVAVVEGDFAVDYLHKNIDGIVLKEYPSYDDVIHAVAEGEVLVFVMDTPIALYHLTRTGAYKQFRRMDEPLFVQNVHIAVKRDNLPLLEKINAGIMSFSEEELVRYRKMWSGVELGRTVSWRLIALVVAAVVLLVLAVLVWNTILHKEIRSRKKREKELAYKATHDQLTGLPNRYLILEFLRQAINQARRHKDSGFAVAFLDIDDFKSVNDGYGHHVGDRCLSTLAQQAKQGLRQADVVGRLAGDEFVILLNAVNDQTDLDLALSRFPSGIEVADDDGSVITVKCSVGALIYSDKYQSAEQILEAADQAMYVSKRSGKGRITTIAD
jgi:diguanylate cyclase (GGDEF)-like protein